MSELKACPFCGSNKIREFISLMPNIGECQNCGAVSSKWQSRPLEDILTAKLRGVIHEIQKHQPAGSPPPGDEVMLTQWIMSTLTARIAELEHECSVMSSELNETEIAIEEGSRILALRAENTKLREALQKYANLENWRIDDWGIVSIFNDGVHGYGNPTGIAEEALK